MLESGLPFGLYVGKLPWPTLEIWLHIGVLEIFFTITIAIIKVHKYINVKPFLAPLFDRILSGYHVSCKFEIFLSSSALGSSS